MASLKFLGNQGHATILFDVLDEASVVAAKAEFDRALGQGATAFATSPGTTTAPEQISQFDPQAAEILMVAPMAGGALGS